MTTCGVISRSTSNTIPFFPSSSRNPPQSPVSKAESRRHCLRRRRRTRRSRRDREGQPKIPAGRPVLIAELLVPLQAEKGLGAAHRDKGAELRADAGAARLEAAEPRAGSAVAGDLVEEIAGEPDKHLFRKELRGAPIEGEIDPVLVIDRPVREVIGKAGGGGKLMPGLQVKKRVRAPAFYWVISEPEIGKPILIIRASRNVSGQVGHEVVHAGVPFERRHRKHVAKPRPRVGRGPRDRVASRPCQRRRYRSLAPRRCRAR